MEAVSLRRFEEDGEGARQRANLAPRRIFEALTDS
jgi:hypothetical protein